MMEQQQYLLIALGTPYTVGLSKNLMKYVSIVKFQSGTPKVNLMAKQMRNENKRVKV